MAETADPDDPDLLARSAPVRLEGGENGEAGAEHRRGVAGLECFWDGKDELLMGANRGSVSALRDDAVGIFSVLSNIHKKSRQRKQHICAHVGVNLLRAVVLVPVLALSALHARPDLRANSDTVSDLDSLDLVADAHGLADDLVSDDEGQLALAPALLEGMHVGAAHAAVADGDFDVVGLERLGRELDDFQVGEFLRVLDSMVYCDLAPTMERPGAPVRA